MTWLNNRWRLVCGPVLALLIFSFAGYAQTPSTASVRGQVVDQNGGAIPGAKVKLANTETGLQREAQTDEAGFYSIPALPLTGHYTIQISNASFANAEVNRI